MGSALRPFKYRIEVFGPPPFDTWQPLMNPIDVRISEWFNGTPQECTPGNFVCNVTLTPTDDGDGFGPGWYDYLEDLKGLHQRFLVVDKLASWVTNSAMEGFWQIRMTAKDSSDPSAPVLFPGAQIVNVRIDNTAPSGPAGPNATLEEIEANPPLVIDGATFNGTKIPANNCGKFPVGSMITGTYEVHDPGTSSPNQHFSSFSLRVIPAGPAHGVNPSPLGGSFPAVDTTGELGHWTLNTKGMDPCGYVIRFSASDRTNVNSVGSGYSMSYDVGFCLEEPPKK